MENAPKTVTKLGGLAFAKDGSAGGLTLVCDDGTTNEFMISSELLHALLVNLHSLSADMFAARPGSGAYLQTTPWTAKSIAVASTPDKVSVMLRFETVEGAILDVSTDKGLAEETARAILAGPPAILLDTLPTKH